MAKSVIGSDSDEVYLHFLKENFLAAIKNNPSLEPNITSQDIKREYEKHKMAAEQRFSTVQQQLSKISNSKDTLDFVKALTTNDSITASVESALSLDSGAIAEVAQRIRALLVNSTEGNSIWERGESIKEALDNNTAWVAMNEVQALISTFNTAVTHISALDQSIFEYCNNKNTKNTTFAQTLSSAFTGSDGSFSILNVNSSMLSSFNTLIKLVNELQNIAKSGTISKSTTITYVNRSGEVKTKVISDFVKGLRAGIIEGLLAPLGEGVGAIYGAFQVNEIISDFAKKLNSVKGITAKVEGIGAGGTNIKMSDGTEKRRTSDIWVTISNKGNKANVEVGFGISAKAQLNKTASTRKVTTFQTSKIRNFLAMVNNVQKYNYMNYAALNMMSSTKAVLLNRYIAALNFDKAVSGEIQHALFLSYLDKVYSIVDFYEMISNAGNSTTSKWPGVFLVSTQESSLSQIRRQGWRMANEDDQKYRHGATNKTSKGEVGWLDDTPAEKTNFYAWARSKELLKMFYNITAQLQWKK